FEAFCQSNAAALPLLFRSCPGQAHCPPLAQEADIRTDIPQYCVYENGQVVKTVSSLKEYSSEFSDMVCFYLGCSFGFEGKLKAAGVPVRNVEQKKNVSMYRTSVSCVPVGVFRCPLVVTMRPVPAEMLDAAVEVTHLNPLAHGAPVHIGDPVFLGIQDLSRPDYGDAVEHHPGDVPVFWACGVTSSEALRRAKPALAFSHSPGFIFRLSQRPLLYSLASKMAVHKIRELEKIVNEGNTSKFIYLPYILLSGLVHCRLPPGLVTMANTLLSLGKRVTAATDRRGLSQDLIEEAVRSGRKGLVMNVIFISYSDALAATIPLVTYEDNDTDSALHFLCQDGDVNQLSYDHLVAVKHSGQAAAVIYNNVKGNQHLEGPLDQLFTAAEDIPGINTSELPPLICENIAILLTFLQNTVKFIGQFMFYLQCLLFLAAVSECGACAVSCGLFLLQNCPSHQRYLKRGLGLDRQRPGGDSEQDEWTALTGQGKGGKIHGLINSNG
uniref:D-glutamate cyclase n=1 Tax=Neogobius melanostomus TaxID=47308 RepID=A0A8C6UWK4_9GOBI